ncbi:MAG: hypothetical protein Q7U10_08715 [Thermodesulfovibrionia bacterium]|nr:hypothetical protein [Thermodesulfovibrionia bacterium]
MSIVSCEKSPVEELQEKATIWINTLHSLTGDEQHDVKAIEEFIEPSSVRGERAKEYYIEWTKDTSYKVIAGSVDEVLVETDGIKGMVRYSMVYEDSSGQRQVISQRTKWKMVDGVWYRIIEMPDIRR